MTADAPKRFPILDDDKIASVPWALVDTPKIRARCLKIHEQSIEQLAKRGGLSPLELWRHIHAPEAHAFSRAWYGVEVPSIAEIRAWLRERGAKP